MGLRIPILLMLLLAMCVALTACGMRHTEVWLWPPANDVADP